MTSVVPAPETCSPPPLMPAELPSATIAPPSVTLVSVTMPTLFSIPPPARLALFPLIVPPVIFSVAPVSLKMPPPFPSAPAVAWFDVMSDPVIVSELALKMPPPPSPASAPAAELPETVELLIETMAVTSMRTPPPSPSPMLAGALAEPSSTAVPPVIVRFSKVTFAPPKIWKTRSTTVCVMKVELPPAPVIVMLLPPSARISRSPSAAAFSCPAELEMFRVYVPASRVMVSTSPLALAVEMASRRLPAVPSAVAASGLNAASSVRSSSHSEVPPTTASPC